MAALSLPERIIAAKLSFVTYVETKDDAGWPQYFYIAVQGNRMPEFKTALQQGGFDPEDFGTVLARGYGKPSDALIEKMEKDYGCKAHGVVLT